MHGGKTFPKRERLQHGHEFRAVYDRGRKTLGKLAVLYVLDELRQPKARVGIVTSRAIGGAVQRNRARRLLREAYRVNKHKLKDNLHMVIAARTAIRDKGLRDVEAELLRLFRAAGVMVEV